MIKINKEPPPMPENEIEEYDTKIFKIPNFIDNMIKKRAGKKSEQEIYQARWVWYHTILAAEIFLTNILLVAILVVLIIGN